MTKLDKLWFDIIGPSWYKTSTFMCDEHMNHGEVGAKWVARMLLAITTSGFIGALIYSSFMGGLIHRLR